MVKTTAKVVGYNEELRPYVVLDDHKIVVDNTMIDDVCEIQCDDNYKLVKYRIVNSSPKRIKAPCLVYDKCGGCSFLHMAYEEELKVKKQYIENLFKDNLKITKVNNVLGMEIPTHYRNKNHVIISSLKGKLVAGFYEESTHKVVEYNDCYIQDELANKIMVIIKELLIKYHYQPYDEDRKTGFIRHIVIKRAIKTNQTMVILITYSNVFPGSKNFVHDLLNKVPNITTVVQNINSKKTNYLFGNENKVLYGKGFIIDELLGFKFKISPRSFYQINPIQTEKLYSEAIRLANFNPNSIIMDAYSGVGTIGICFSKKVKKVISVELVKDAYYDAVANVKLNNIKNVDLYCADATEFIKTLSKTEQKMDGIILDPPRSGTTIRFVNAVKRLSPKTVVYISCNPVTLVRDLANFVDMYHIKTIQPVDMFPHTSSIETIVIMSKK